nr:sigma-70 family RNA polymerase sigma factor [Brevundimonas diminuta]
MTRPETSIDAVTRRLLDEYLVVAARAGDQRAFADLVRRWQRRLVAHAWRLTGDDDAAREAVQSGWLDIVRGLGRLQDERAFPAWAYRIISRRCARHIAGAQGQRELARAAAAEPAPEPIQSDLEQRDEVKRLHAALRELPPPQRAAVALFHFEDLSIPEIAVALGVPAGTIKTRLMHARRRLRTVLEGEDHA